MSSTINPFLWFDDQARAAADFYVATFPDAKLLGGSPMVVSVEVGGLKLSLVNGGPQFKIDPSISFFYNCDSEAEIDRLWNALSREGTVLMPLDAYPFARRYGWLADRFGVNWQLILPSAPPRQKAFPSLMFTREVCGRAEEALRFYTSVFKDSSVGTLSRYGAGQAPDREGTLNYGEFSLGGPNRHSANASEGISLYVRCENQGEIDYFGRRLSEGGSESQCGWLKDRFGVSWQVVPRVLEELMADPRSGSSTDPARSKRVVEAFMKMRKFDIETLLNA